MEISIYVGGEPREVWGFKNKLANVFTDQN